MFGEFLSICMSILGCLTTLFMWLVVERLKTMKINNFVDFFQSSLTIQLTSLKTSSMLNSFVDLVFLGGERAVQMVLPERRGGGWCYYCWIWISIRILLLLLLLLPLGFDEDFQI